MSEQQTLKYPKEILSAYVDGELTQQQSQAVRLHIESCGPSAEIVHGLQEIKHMIKESDVDLSEQNAIDEILNESIAKNIRWVGWSAVCIGLSIALVFVVYHFLVSSEVSLIEKIFTSLIWGGLVGVFISVARQQYLARKLDKFKGVKL